MAMEPVELRQRRCAQQFPMKKRQCGEKGPADPTTCAQHPPSKKEIVSRVDQNECRNVVAAAVVDTDGAPCFGNDRGLSAFSEKAAGSQTEVKAENAHRGHAEGGDCIDSYDGKARRTKVEEKASKREDNSSPICRGERKRTRMETDTKKHTAIVPLSPPTLTSSRSIESSSSSCTPSKSPAPPLTGVAAVRRRTRFLRAQKSLRTQSAQSIIAFLSNEPEEEKRQQLVAFRSRAKAALCRNKVELYCRQPSPPCTTRSKKSSRQVGGDP